jgi:hypothetical protein
MKKHTKIYMNHFGFKIPEDCFCEICGVYANDIHHIEARGNGGNPNKDKDVIENLMALCRQHHIIYGDVPNKKEWLKEIHLKFVAKKST